MRIMSLRSAVEDRAIKVGTDKRAAMLMPQQTVFVAEREWDAACTAEAKTMREWRGDIFLVPPFACPAVGVRLVGLQGDAR